jgi:hypothetical protein
MVEGLIDGATLRQLFADYAASADLVGIREKGDRRMYADMTDLMPEVALDRLLDAKTRAMQIRYRYAGFEWTDTILGTQSGFRVVRCRHET